MAKHVVRLGVSLEPELLAQLDRWVLRRNCRSRSDALRSLIRQGQAGERQGDPGADAAGTVTLLYRHDAPQVQRRLTAAQHRWGEHIRSAVHVHLTDGACLEVLILTGTSQEVRRAAEDLKGVKGVVQGEVALTLPSLAGGHTGHRHPHRGGRPLPPGAHPVTDGKAVGSIS